MTRLTGQQYRKRVVGEASCIEYHLQPRAASPPSWLPPALLDWPGPGPGQNSARRAAAHRDLVRGTGEPPAPGYSHHVPGIVKHFGG